MTQHYRWDALTREHVAAWAELVNHLATLDGTEEFYSVEDLAEEFDSPGFDPHQDSFGVWAGQELVGFGQVWVSGNVDEHGQVRCWLNGGVHGDHRGRGLGRRLMDRLEARAAEAAAERHPGAGFFWQVSGGRPGSSAEQMFTSRGYEVVRYFNMLTRPVSAPLPVPPEVPGVRFRPAEPSDSGEVRDAHRIAFADHWGTIPATDEAWIQRWNAASHRLPMSTVAVDHQGTVLSYVLCGQWVDRELYVNSVGTRPEYRGRGLAQATLLHTLHRAAHSGAYDVVDLEVDSHSPTGATRLYERIGFTHKFTTSTLRKDGAGR